MIKVEYVLTGLNGAADLQVSATADGVAVNATLLKSAVSGDVYGITDLVGSITIDPAVLFGGAQQTISSFEVTLTASDSAENVSEVLYKIFDLTDGSHTDVTRAELLNGHYGAIETDYAKVGEGFGITGFNTLLSDVLIWTGVTNYPGARTTKLVMRKIPAKGKSFIMGRSNDACLADSSNNQIAHSVSFTNDYYMAVYELTVGQIEAAKEFLGCTSQHTVNHTNEWRRAERPIGIHAPSVRRHIIYWPTNGHAEVDVTYSLVNILRKETGDTTWDLPTEAVWEYACRAGTDTDFNCGLNYTAGNGTYSGRTLQAKLMRCTDNSGFSHSNLSTGDFNQRPEDGGSAVVGTYAPNAWGLYDMLGNVNELCLDSYVADISSYTGDDPWGPVHSDVGNHESWRVHRGGAYYLIAGFLTAAYRGGDWSNNQAHYRGLRLCLTVYE